MRILLSLSFLALIGCQTISKDNKQLLRLRYGQLQPLSQFPVRTCEIETRLSEPTKQKYMASFPKEKKLIQAESWSYKWRVSESRCEITPQNSTPLVQSHRPIVNAAFCTLLQSYWVNSPFDGLNVEATDVKDREKDVFIQVGAPEFGISIDRQDFLITTLTKSRGLLKAHYAEQLGQWLPDWMEMKLPKATLKLDQFTYRDGLGKRNALENFWINVGEDDTTAHTQVSIVMCN